jgi:hypothetical protein
MVLQFSSAELPTAPTTRYTVECEEYATAQLSCKDVLLHGCPAIICCFNVVLQEYAATQLSYKAKLLCGCPAR